MSTNTVQTLLADLEGDVSEARVAAWASVGNPFTHCWPGCAPGQDKFSTAAWKPAAKALTFSPLFVPAILFPEFQPDKTVHNVQNNTATKTHFQIYQNRMIWLSLYCNLDTKMTFPVFTESVLYNF